MLEDIQEEVSQLISWTTNFTARWEGAGLPEAATLGMEVQHLFSCFSKQLSGEASPNAVSTQTPLAYTSYAQACQASTTIPDNLCQSTGQQAKQSARPLPAQRKVPRVFLRLPPLHQARQASPHATLAHLRQHPKPLIAKGIKEVQRVPTGLALIPINTDTASQLISQHSDLEHAISGAKAELEQEWAVYALPQVPSNYLGFDGMPVEINEQMVKEEFTFQTGLKPHRFYISKNPGSRTYIMLLPKTPSMKVPPRVSLFGQSVLVRHKPKQLKVTQCPHCWGFHDPRKCTRKPQCRLCSSSDHIETTHPVITSQLPKCTNCLGPHQADHTACPARPTVQQGSIHRPSRLQIRAIRQAGMRQNPSPPSTGQPVDRPAQSDNTPPPPSCKEV